MGWLDMVNLALGPGVFLQVSAEQASRLRREIDEQMKGASGMSQPETFVLHDEHPMWAQRTMNPGHDGPEWDQETDLALAEAFYSALSPKARVFLDVLIDHPGRPLAFEDLGELSGGVFTSSRSVAGALNGLLRPQQRSGRRYPYAVWEGDPTRYAMKPMVAGLFGRARHDR